MRHGKKLNHLGRKVGHRKALFKNQANSLLTHKRIITTLAKAKALRVFVEPLITKAKKDTTHSRRVVFGYLQDKKVVSDLFGEISAKIGDRPGGYTRIIKTGFRKSDGAEMAMIELVDYNELLLNKPKSGAKKKKTRRRGGKSSAAAAATAVIANEVIESQTEDAEDNSTSEEE